jgi:putative tricarboxylic transport membrane protein
MAFVLGPQAENAIRQSLILSDNNLMIFVERPISATVLCLAVIVVILAIVSRRRGAKLPTKDSVGPADDDIPTSATEQHVVAAIPEPQPEVAITPERSQP